MKPKKPRKKTKPSALTRPPKKGKKKKNQKKSSLRPQKPIIDEHTARAHNQSGKLFIITLPNLDIQIDKNTVKMHILGLEITEIRKI